MILNDLRDVFRWGVQVEEILPNCETHFAEFRKLKVCLQIREGLYSENLRNELMLVMKQDPYWRLQSRKIHRLRLKKAASLRMVTMRRLDTYRDAAKNGKAWLAELEQEERERTGIKSLKIGYNRIFGYYIEITKSNIHLADLERYERKQTLANAERYITPELKEKEDLILNAEAEGLELEYDLFSTVRDGMKTYIRQIQRLASVLK